MENYFTPLNTESQATDYTNINTNQQTPSPMRTRNEAIRDAKLAAAAAAAAANHQPPSPEDVQNADTGAHAAVAENETEATKAEAAAAHEARLKARLAAEA